MGYSAEKVPEAITMSVFVCSACGLNESKCQCDHFCILCRADHNVRLCQDGCYYCAECREVCEFTTSDLPEE